MSDILSDVVAEGRRLGARAEKEGLPLRLLGGVAIRLRSTGEPAPAFARSYGDLDWATVRGGSANAQRFFSGAGYAPDVAFNALNGRDRLLFYDEANGRQVDVFVGSFRMCHEIPFNERLENDLLTLPLAELVMTKLQIVEINEKDVRDALALFCDHDVSESDGETINGARIADLCAVDWGLWRTLTANIETCRTHLDRFELTPEEKGRIEDRIRRLQVSIEQHEKTRKWRLRARVGERKRWYELPEEVNGGPG